MAIHTAFVRNFLSAARPWVEHNDTYLNICDVGVIVTSYLGSVFCVHDSWNEISSGLRGIQLLTEVMNGVDKHYFASIAPGQEYLIVRHGVLNELKTCRKSIFSGIVKGVFGVAFLVMTVAMLNLEDARSGRRNPEIFWSLAAMFAAFPFFLFTKWSTFKTTYNWSLLWRHFAQHLNAVNLHEDEPIAGLLTRAFDNGFGDINNMYDIVSVIDKNHVPAWKTNASANPYEIARLEIEAVGNILSKIEAEFANRNADKRAGIMNSSLSLAQEEALARSHSAEKKTIQSFLSFICYLLGWYGYVVRIIVYFYPHQQAAHCCWCSLFLSIIKLNLSDEAAILWLKFIADVAFAFDNSMDLKLVSVSCDEDCDSNSDSKKVN